MRFAASSPDGSQLLPSCTRGKHGRWGGNRGERFAGCLRWPGVGWGGFDVCIPGQLGLFRYNKRNKIRFKVSKSSTVEFYCTPQTVPGVLNFVRQWKWRPAARSCSQRRAPSVCGGVVNRGAHGRRSTFNVCAYMYTL